MKQTPQLLEAFGINLVWLGLFLKPKKRHVTTWHKRTHRSNTTWPNLSESWPAFSRAFCFSKAAICRYALSNSSRIRFLNASSVLYFSLISCDAFVNSSSRSFSRLSSSVNRFFSAWTVLKSSSSCAFDMLAGTVTVSTQPPGTEVLSFSRRSFGAGASTS